MHKETVNSEHAFDLTQRVLRAIDVIARSEIDYDIKRAVAKRELSDISHLELHRNSGVTGISARFVDKALFDVDGGVRPRLTQARDWRERHSSAATDLEDTGGAREAKGSHHRGHFD
jgi:hypothetical protein